MGQSNWLVAKKKTPKQKKQKELGEAPHLIDKRIDAHTFTFLREAS
jgi:hypothetical protein